MASFRKELTDLIRPNIAGGKFSKDLVDGIDLVLDRAGVPRDDGAAPASPRTNDVPPRYRKAFTDLCRPHLSSGFSAELVAALDAAFDRAGVPRDGGAAATPAPAEPVAATPASADGVNVPPGKLDVPGLRRFLGLASAGTIDAEATQALFARLTNSNPGRLSDADIARGAARLGVAPKVVKAVRDVEVKGKAFDATSRPTILYERHIFAEKSGNRFNASHPDISSKVGGGYGKFSEQYPKLARACALDPDAAFQACSWGAFQVLGSNAVAIGYKSAFEMALLHVTGEGAHLDAFIAFIIGNQLVDELKACRAGDPDSCIPFVRRYNGPKFRDNDYHTKLANALK
jgi:hypothetical protein